MVDRVLGSLYRTLGDFDQSAAHFEDAINTCQDAEDRIEYSWTCYEYAQTLLQRRASGNREKAQSLLQEGQAVATESGSP